ncbi:LamG-like jellyroll fold domain-containing protein [Luteipulveratus flavus]|uniref:Beta galactosidase jelly roll domain-containing protein n=1 Tax=Luteipulveratus flavus TaxID=3031728 RepID=A0ABT6C8M9_9MICO|nr:LamG-like jellyroll fold domain-containing protein [Luteipulveratus sp. YIM 133296]MDF8264883.1 beta galactosidase jelly roll domain-containing protein [Luteipulveratus sp. YIM 133296]
MNDVPQGRVPASPPWRRLAGIVLAIVALLIAPPAIAGASTGPLGAAKPGEPWHPAPVTLPTPWTNQVSPTNALPEYPRPQLTRTSWQSLNGLWQFAGASANEAPPVGRNLAEQILVPYPTESALSGIKRHEDYMWYRRTIDVPQSWKVGKGQRLMMNFGAVDYKATVWVNGKQVGQHTGGYGAFSVDVTDALTGKGPQEVIVGVEDRADATWQPVGKQRLVPDRGIFYTGASGIWQSVWMEPVATDHVVGLDMTPDIDTNTLALTARTSGSSAQTVSVVVRDGKKVVSRTTGPANQKVTVPVPNAKLWSPDSPFLYDLEVTLLADGKHADRVGSYAGMREIGNATGKDGKLHITLNHKITFLMSTLDQGYWPDGIYTAPTDEALRFDVAQTKALGFNTIRKHIKVEPDRWYYHADKLGMMVWQDMPAMKTGGEPPEPARNQFESELHEMVNQHKSWTSVIGWIPFNEGWGEWSKTDTGRIADEVKAWDPSRLVNAHSGVNCCNSHGDSGRGDVIDWHQYTGPAQPVPSGDRVSIDGEHGGFGLEVPGHMWFGDGGAYQMADDSAELTRFYVDNQRAVLDSAKRCGISGAVYTQTTDVEHEVNGFYTYDRQVKKMDFAQVKAVNDAIVQNADGSGAPPPSTGPGTPGIAGVHAYTFDENGGTTAKDSVGSANMALTNATWVPGVRGTAVHFAGNGEGDTGASLVKTNGSYSVSAWAKLDVADGAFQTVVSQDTGEASAFFLQYSGADQRWAMSFVGLRALSPTKPEVGRWYHLTGVRDATAGTLSLYVDGQKVATQQACTAPASSGHTVIGRGQYGGQKVDYLRGATDDVRLFDRALTDAEVAQLAQQR